ncbi:hypothetical protein JYB64_16950 [Algoriphagus aestuarii]|nr:hypothetical protein [Algoriphagus aestuarii]
MKKISSILLLACFAIYQFGYYAFYFSYENHLEAQWEEQIFDLEDSQLEERMLEVPLAVPYMSYQEDFQVTNTKFEKDGKYYRAIKQRYTKETLQIIYVPDTSRAVLDQTFQTWISSIVGDELPQDQNGKSLQKNFVKDYIQNDFFSFVDFEKTTYQSLLGFVFLPYQNPTFTIDSPPPQFS